MAVRDIHVKFEFRNQAPALHLVAVVSKIDMVLSAENHVRHAGEVSGRPRSVRQDTFEVGIVEAVFSGPRVDIVHAADQDVGPHHVRVCQMKAPVAGLLLCGHVIAGMQRAPTRGSENLKLCRRAVNNIGTRRVEEHIYQVDDEGKSFQIVAGCGSVNYFRDNMYKRSAEAFYNFEYMLNRDPELFSLAEFQIYERLHLALVAAQPRDSLRLADERYKAVKAIVERRYFGAANGTATPHSTPTSA